ncbi:MAG: ChbG/HpnK family deacetylase [Longimicrobiaceae bacterium]
MPIRLLICNADDFGMDEAVNHGVARAFREGAVRSTSLLVRGRAWRHAVELARGLAGLETGLHLNVTEGACAAPAARVGLLAHPDGAFRFDPDDLPASLGALRARSAGPSFLGQLRSELLHQAERFAATGLELGHVNAHHYFPLLSPALFDVYVSVAEELRVPFRGMVRPMLDLLRTPPGDVAAMEERVRRAGAAAPSVSLSSTHDAAPEPPGRDAFLRAALDRLREIDADGAAEAVEQVCHPVAEPGVPRDGYAWARRLETELVTAPALLELAAGRGWRLGGYGALAAAGG